MGLFLLTYGGYSRDGYWSGRPIDDREGVPTRLGKYMIKNRFKEKMKALWFTNKDKPDTWIGFGKYSH